MRIIPQEIVDMVIDELAAQCEFPLEKLFGIGAHTPPQVPADTTIGQLVDCESSYPSISYFSTVSRHWLARIQKHHFESVWFTDEDCLDKWRANIEPNPSGVSRHVRKLTWVDLDSLEDFNSHIRAFTRIEVLAFDRCEILLLPSVVETFAPMGSSLVRLEIDGAPTRTSVITSLLAALPHLRHLRAHYIEVLDDGNAIVFPPRIPVFENPNSLDLLLGEDTPGSLDWIPPSAQFHDLRINTLCIIDEPGHVKQWIISSASSLKSLRITGDLENSPFDPPDLSGCTGLEYLELEIMFPQPGTLAGTVLPSLCSLPPPKIVLKLVLCLVRVVDLQAWGLIGGHLCLLAERFKTIHPGSKMEVKFSVGRFNGRFIPALVELFKAIEAMVKLGKHASVVIAE